MNQGLAVVSNVAEIFSVGGLTVGILLLCAALVAQLLDGTWIATRAAVEHDEHGPLVRWFGDDGAVHAHGLTRAQFAQTNGEDWLDVYFRRGAAHRMRLERASGPVRLLRLLGGIVTGVGVLAVAVSFIVMFVGA